MAPGDNSKADDSHAVRFASQSQEIGPDTKYQDDADNSDDCPTCDQYKKVTEDELAQLPTSCRELQKRRMCNFEFEAYSLPSSRASSPNRGARQSDSPRSHSRNNSILPLTPAATRSHEEEPRRNASPRRSQGDLGLKITPAPSPRTGTPPPARLSEHKLDERSSSVDVSAQSTKSETSTRPTSISNESGSGTQTPGHPPERPYTPAGEVNDPYARHKRPPQNTQTSEIEPRFVFGGKRNGSGTKLSVQDDHNDRRASQFALPAFGRKEKDEKESHHTSILDLKRYLKIGHKKRGSTSSNSGKSDKEKEKPKTPVRTNSPIIPFADDHGLESKYGKFGRILGAGAGGSVRVLKRSSDGVQFAVKEFRPQHAYESNKEYAKKVTAEFCIGSTLHHGNIIETLDIVHERGKWFEVMEYAPYDLFNIVMSGKMSREEVSCCFVQILSGVTYIHQMGLAHRDLKLDNIVVNDRGIMKLIDFGSAVVYQYPFENDIVLAHGVTGSDPYLAPEVFNEGSYNPPTVDIWSLAIIYCCMTLRRFPWKVPRVTDNSYKLFTAPPSANTPKSLLPRAASSANLEHPPDYKDAFGNAKPQGIRDDDRHHHHHRHEHEHSEPASRASGDNFDAPDPSSMTHTDAEEVQDAHVDLHSPVEEHEKEKMKSEPVRGPWRLLRLLPRESRYIMNRMLQVDPENRATLKEVWQEPWIRNIPFCWQEPGGEVHHGDGHEHTLVKGDA